MGPLGKRTKGVAKMDAKSGEMAPIFDENFWHYGWSRNLNSGGHGMVFFHPKLDP